MNEDKLNELLGRCESEIERELLQNLYPHLTTDRAQELCVQHMIDSFSNVTIPDFAFPDKRIAIYCDSFEWHKGKEAFKKDRFQSRELQLRGWIVLRFAGSEINHDSEMVVETIRRSITRRERQRDWEWGRLQQQDQQRSQKPQTQQKPEGGLCGVIVLACVIVGILVLLDFIF